MSEEERVSPTLAYKHHKSEAVHWDYKRSGYGGSAQRVNAKKFGPTDDYPAPWRITESPEGICAIYAANNEKVADWLAHSDAQAILQEISGDD